jgi:hypothetical protein
MITIPPPPNDILPESVKSLAGRLDKMSPTELIALLSLAAQKLASKK